MANIYAERARALVGVPFRPQGRDLAGLDCVGLAMQVFDLPADAIRDDYRLRGRHGPEALALVRRYFRGVPSDAALSGDLLLLAPRFDQIHFAVLTCGGFVHAHARLRRVVETPGRPEWPLVAVFRRSTGRRTS